MNFFELYQLPIKFKLNLSILKRKYIEISKLTHPDLHTLSSTNNQMEMLEKSTINNKAYSTLKNNQSRIKYILTSLNVIDKEKQHKMPKEFLGEMMEMNESIMELKMDYKVDKKIKALQQLDKIIQNLNNESCEWTNSFDNGNESIENLKNIKGYYFKMKYLSRLKANINELNDN